MTVDIANDIIFVLHLNSNQTEDFEQSDNHIHIR